MSIVFLAGCTGMGAGASGAQGVQAAHDDGVAASLVDGAAAAARDAAALAADAEPAEAAPGGEAAAGSASPAEEPVMVQAIWKEQEIDFYFQSFTTFYSCSSLARKIERILKELGARATVRVRDFDCPFSVARMPYVRIHLYSPVEATPAALAEYEQGRSRRELVARVRGERLDESADMARFAAAWKEVRLSGRLLDLDSGDCELLMALRRAVLPKLAVRITRDDRRCPLNQSVRTRLQLQMQALLALPQPDAQ